MENDIILYGASGHCRVVIENLESANEKVRLVLDDNPKHTEINGVQVVVPESFILKKEHHVIVSIGNNKTRKAVAKKISASFHTAIHSKAIVSKYAAIGNGSVVMAGTVINAGAAIGRHCIINTGAVVEHDCAIGDYTHISPQAALAGDVHVGEGTHIGIGACIIQGIRIGRWATIGAGAIIIKDVPDYAVVVGNPGRIIKYNAK